jgi:hypothetical protein
MKWPAPSTYTTGGLRDWSEHEEQVNGSFGSPHVTKELRRQCRKNTALFVVLIACLYRSGIKKYVRTNRTEKSFAHNE